MSNRLLQIYHYLPAPLQSAAASLRGYQLRSWRYGAETDHLVAEALERERWSAEKWKQWQEEKLARLLHRAATRVPYYRAYWEDRRRRGDKSSFEALVNWPVLLKETVRPNPAAFVADDCDTRTMFEDHTSGTTGTPLATWLTRETVRGWYALFEARTRRWHGFTRNDRWGMLGGQPIVPPNRKTPPYWVWNAALRQLYLSAMHIAPWSVSDYLKAIQEYRLRYLLGYSSSLYFLALEAKACGERLSIELAVTNAEPLYDYQRRAIAEAFQCRIQETYGLAEAVCMATECSANRLHLWPEAGIVELLDEHERPVPPGRPGRIIATGLANPDMPLVRYDTRDLGQFPGHAEACPCGRSLPILEKVWGRWDDAIITADGRKPVLLDRIFDPPLRVREAQIIQEAIGEFRVRVVPTEGWSQADEKLLRGSLINLVGPAEVRIELTHHIERTWAGKFRIIISKVKT